MRLINAEELLEKLKKSCKYHAENSRELSLLQRDINIVKEQPTVDAIPVKYILKRMDEMNEFITEWGGVAEKDALVDSYVHDVCALARLVCGWRKEE